MGSVPPLVSFLLMIPAGWVHRHRIWSGIGSQGIAGITAHSAVQYGAVNGPIARPVCCLNPGDNAHRGDPTAVPDSYPLRFLMIVVGFRTQASPVMFSIDC